MVSKQKHLTVAEKIKLLDFYERGNVSARNFANKFGIGGTRNPDLIKNKDEVLKLWKFHGNDAIKTIKRRKTKLINANDIVHDRFYAARTKNVSISNPIFEESLYK